jgi:hypothetical protein
MRSPFHHPDIPMNFRTLANLTSLLFFMLAATWVFAPEFLLSAWGVDSSSQSGLVERRLAALYLGVGVMFFSARTTQLSSARTAMATGVIVTCLALAALGIFELASGHAKLGILSAVLVEVALALAFIYVVRTQK